MRNLYCWLAASGGKEAKVRAACLLIVLLVLAVLFTACGKSKAATVELAPNMVLTEGDMPGMHYEGAGHCELDWHRIYVPGTVNAYRECCASSFVTEEAFSGEGRTQIDAQTRADGYDPNTLGSPGSTPEPFRPIHGPFILSHHGIFEAYDTVYLTSTLDGAHQEYERLAEQATSQEFVASVTPTSFGDEGETVEMVMGPDANVFQTAYHTVWRRGRAIGYLNTMGSPDLQMEDNLRLAELMDSRMQTENGIYTPLPTETPGATVEP